MVPSQWRQHCEQRENQHQQVGDNVDEAVDAVAEMHGQDLDHRVAALQVPPGQEGEDGEGRAGLDQFEVAGDRRQSGKDQRPAGDGNDGN